MINKTKKYFSLFGVLIATVSRKILSINCMFHSLLLNNIPKITKLLLSTQLKPIKLYSTNYIYKKN